MHMDYLDIPEDGFDVRRMTLLVFGCQSIVPLTILVMGVGVQQWRDRRPTTFHDQNNVEPAAHLGQLRIRPEQLDSEPVPGRMRRTEHERADPSRSGRTFQSVSSETVARWSVNSGASTLDI